MVINRRQVLGFLGGLALFPKLLLGREVKALPAAKLPTATTLNEALFDKLQAATPAHYRGAVDAINSYTRLKMREEGFFRRIMPLVPISDSELDRSVPSDGFAYQVISKVA